MPHYRPYPYVGPEHLKLLGRSGDCISPDDTQAILDWSKRQLSAGRNAGLIPATFVVDCHERLWIADRRSEHVACANGGPVLAAGELVLSLERNGIEVAEVTNQSTGFCPEAGCWEVVARTLDRLCIRRPEAWTHAFAFRRCPGCRSINVIKDEVLECDVCGAELPDNWNFGGSDRQA